ncbi:MAG: hypothetical protein KF800_20510 [Lysobacter sp.]|nr:hypothetical protein [Lysobacter sp.]
MAVDKAKGWGVHQKAQRESGMSVAAYCRRHGLSYTRWMYWQRRLGTGALKPIAVSSPASVAAAMTVTLSLPGGACVRVRGVCAADLVALVRGLSC